VRLRSPNSQRSFASNHLPSTEGNRRPEIPNNEPWAKDLAQIIESCWEQAPPSRPGFSEVVAGVEVIGREYNVPVQHARLHYRKYRVRFPWCRTTDSD